MALKQQKTPLSGKTVKSRDTATWAGELSLKKNLLWISVLIFVTAVLYSPVVNFEFTKLDDDYQVTENPDITALDGQHIRKIFSSYYIGMYQPLTTLTYAAEYTINGLDPAVYHVSNLVLHLLNIFLVFFLVRKLTRNRLIMILSTVFFAVHPMFVEVVAWISARSGLLFTAFYTLSLITYLNYLDHTKRLKFYLLTLLFFLLGLFSKASMMTLPAMLILFDYFRDRKINAKTLLEKLPFFALTIVFGIVSIYARKESGQANQAIDFSFIERVFISSYQVIWYIFKLIFPFNLTAWLPTPEKLPLLVYLSPVAAILLAAAIFYLKKHRKILIFGLFFFGIMISVVLNFFADFGSITSNRYAYPSYLGLFYILGMGLNQVVEKYKIKSADTAKTIFSGTILLLGFYYTALSHNRLKDWKDDFTIWNDIIEKNENVQVAWCNRGNAYVKMGKPLLALQDYDQAIKLDPEDYDAYYNRGTCYFNIRKYKEALSDLNKAVELNPRMVEAWCNRGNCLRDMGRPDEAVSSYNKAIEISPGFSEAYLNRGIAFELMKRVADALKDYNKAIELYPSNKAYSARGSLKEKLGQYDEAIQDFNTALEIEKFPLTYAVRGLTKAKSGDLNGAIEDYNTALSLNPADSITKLNKMAAEQQLKSGIQPAVKENPAVRLYNEGCILGEQGKYREAISKFDEALKKDPSFKLAYGNRAVAYYALGDYKNARKDIESAEKLGHVFQKEFLDELDKAEKKNK